jgi:CRISPR-associated protein Cst2
MRSKFMEIAFLTKVEKSNINAAGTDGNITSLKKTTEIDDTQRVFISGVSLKYSIKEYLRDLGYELSPIKGKEKGEGKERGAQITTECNPAKYIDDDLFGYMDTKSDNKRVAPVKTNGMIALFPYKNDMNRGVRFDPEGQNHSLYDLEIVTTVFRSNWAIELDRIGIESLNSKDNKNEINIRNEEKERRVKAFLESIFNLWSRVKQSNYLTSISPQMIVLVFRDDKTLTIGDKLMIDENYNLNIDSLIETIDYHKNRIKEIYIGYSNSFIKNANKLIEKCQNHSIEVIPIAELKNKVLSNEFRLFT